MNWFQKISSITFSLEGSEKIAQPRTISRLAYDFLEWARPRVPRYFLEGNWNMIDMDGLEPHETTGTINWYFRPEEYGGQIPASETDDIPMYMRQWYQEELAPLGYQINIRGPEESKAFAGDLHVYRLDILNNPTAEYMTWPSLNMTNNNAKEMFTMLGIGENYTGSLPLEWLKSKLESISEIQMTEFTENPREIGGNEEARQIHFGRPLEQIKYYVRKLQEIVDIGLQNGFTSIQWG